MPRGRHFYGPGFWKYGTGWVPGAGGFRGGAYWGAPRPCWGWWGPCHRPGLPPVHPVPAEPDEIDAEEEVGFLKTRASRLEAELREVQERLREMDKPEPEDSDEEQEEEQ